VYLAVLIEHRLVMETHTRIDTSP